MSYLEGHTKYVVIGIPNTTGAKSVKVTFSFGVPQDSVLRPILFTQYTCPLGQICDHHNVLPSPMLMTSKYTCHPGWVHQMALMSFILTAPPESRTALLKSGPG